MSQQILNLYPIDYPFETLISRASASPKKLILNPDFQRKYKWDKDGYTRASRFIESCLMRIPIPACYFAENENGSHNVIDGVQRITTIKNFFNNEFALEGLTIYEELNGKKFSDLGSFQADLESTTIRCVVLRKDNPKALVHEIFARLNQGAVKLSDQEIRHAIYPGSLDAILCNLGTLTTIRDFKTKNWIDEKANEELALRHFAFKFSLDSYEGRLTEWLNQFMAENANISEEMAERWTREFNETLDKCIRTFDYPFVNSTTQGNTKSIALFDLLMLSFSQLENDFIDSKKRVINQKFVELLSDPAFSRTLSGGLQQKTAINNRIKLWEQKLSEIA